ncbi:MAG: galactose mutarotase [Acidobacteriota bacterium]|jgi:aldose 1-epimerase|nr:galactose mutarotase [Acidobacteriota bacterium]
MKNTEPAVCMSVLMLVLLAACGQAPQNSSLEPATPAASAAKSDLDFAKFDKLVDGKQNRLHMIKNANGMEVYVTNFGARIVAILVPDNKGVFQDVVLGFDNIDDYLKNRSDFGATIGRYGNRIAKGKFQLDGAQYQLPLNNGPNSLHGGFTGFQFQMFDIRQVDGQTLECSLRSPDNDNGYPGNLDVKLTYKVLENNALELSYEAVTDKPTVLNLTNHSYFNLSGDPGTTTMEHTLYLAADEFTPTDAGLIPTGEIAAVNGTPMDFIAPTVVGERIDSDYGPLKAAGGYDHNWIFRKGVTPETVAGTLACPSSGIVMDVYTSEPAVQFYTANFLDGSQIGKKGIAYRKRSGLCLETQHYPDSPNHANFPSTVLRPGEKFQSRTVYAFGVR